MRISPSSTPAGSRTRVNVNFIVGVQRPTRGATASLHAHILSAIIIDSCDRENAFLAILIHKVYENDESVDGRPQELGYACINQMDMKCLVINVAVYRQRGLAE